MTVADPACREVVCLDSLVMPTASVETLLRGLCKRNMVVHGTAVPGLQVISKDHLVSFHFVSQRLRGRTIATATRFQALTKGSLIGFIFRDRVAEAHCSGGGR